MRRRALLLSLTILAATPTPASSQTPTPPDLSKLTLEELLNVDITSVSRKPQSLSHAPAAVFVMTQDDIRQSGASSLPEVLRLAPGVQVARYSGSKWSISARGMGVYYGSKLLVLVDGRSVFTPDFSGVHWDLQEVPLDSIERIEIVRGPGGTMWGANAFNGIINVITKSSAETPGGLAVFGTGTEDRGLASFRYGGAAGAHTTYRFDASLSNRAFDGADPRDDTRQIARGGFRLDRRSDRSAVIVHGDLYAADERLPLTLPDVAAPSYARIVDDHVRAQAGNVAVRWTRTLSSASDVSIEAYIDHSRRDEYIHEYTSDALNLDLQHRFRLGPHHDVIWGAEYRQTRTDISVSDVMRYVPGRTNRYRFDAFAQDEIALTPKLSLTVGSKIEEHEEVGPAFEPNARLMWSPHARHNVWAAVSRGVRTPSLSDQNSVFDYTVIAPSAATRGLPVLIQVVGEPELDLESVVAFEAGYRLQPTPTVAFDVAAFRNEYRHLSSYARGAAQLSLAGGVPHLVVESRTRISPKARRTVSKRSRPGRRPHAGR